MHGGCFNGGAVEYKVSLAQTHRLSSAGADSLKAGRDTDPDRSAHTVQHGDGFLHFAG